MEFPSVGVIPLPIRLGFQRVPQTDIDFQSDFIY